MRVLFISANRTEINMRTMPFGMACVAESARRAGHEVRILDLMGAADASEGIRDTIAQWRPEAIGISLRNIDDQNMRSPQLFLAEANAVIGQVKSLSSAPIILGGAGYSIFPEAILERSLADMGIWGEGEKAFSLLLQRLEGRQSLAGVPGLFVRTRGVQGERTFVTDLDELPLPDADLLGAAAETSGARLRGEAPQAMPVEGALSPINSPTLPVQTRRGCPLGCAYCSTASIEGEAIRCRSPKEVVGWIAPWAERHVHQLYFVDNTFNLPAPYAKDLCRALAAAPFRVSWRAIVYPSPLEEDLAALMAEAGCTEASVGFESGCERILEGMNKHFGLDDIRQTRDSLRRAGVKSMGFLLLGGPGETRDSVEESLAFADSLDLESLKVTIGIRIYPHTPLAARAREEGMIAADDDLLYPRFYMAPGIEDWLREKMAEYAETRPNWIVDR